MEKFFSSLEKLSPEIVRSINPQSLAFVGDSVYTLYVRTMLIEKYDCKSNQLHTLANDFVKAKGQSDAIEKIINILDDNEIAIFKRARNYHTHSVAKNASVVDYKRATGLEAVIGYLYLTGNFDRLNYILDICIKGETDESRR